MKVYGQFRIEVEDSLRGCRRQKCSHKVSRKLGGINKKYSNDLKKWATFTCEVSAFVLLLQCKERRVYNSKGLYKMNSLHRTN